MGQKIEFTSRMSLGETIAALIWLPVHLLLLPLAVVWLFPQLSMAGMNLLVYAVGAVYMVAAERKFLRRDFDPLVDRVGQVFLQIVVCYGLMLLFNMAVNLLVLLLAGEGENPNNAAVFDMAGAELGKTSAMAICLAPIVEELIFRGGIFGLIRRRSRALAYAVSMLLFAVYHVWGYALADPIYWLYLLQYLPISYLLCRCYERTNTIWGNIFLHMLVNAMSLQALELLQGLV